MSSTTISNPTANPLVTTTYTVTITNNASGCTSTDEVVVTVDNLIPTANAGSDFTKTCVSNSNGSQIGEIAQPDHTYLWSPGAGLSSTISSNPMANPVSTTTYTVTITNTSSGCTSTDEVEVTVDNSLPIANAGSDFTKTCVLNASGASIGEVAQPGHTYLWSPGAGLSSPTASNPTANPLFTTIYTVEITNTTTGCTTTDDVEIIVNTSPPTVNAGSDFMKTCVQNINGSQIGEPYQPGHTYLWSPGIGLSSTTASSPFANPTVSTSYTVTITDNSNGCTSSDVVDVLVNTNPPTASAGFDFTKTCLLNSFGSSIGATPLPGHTYSWFPNDGLSSNSSSNPLANPMVSTTYTVTITDSTNGCTSTDNVTVNVNTTLPTVDAGSDFTKTCVDNPSGTSIGELSQPGHTYLWSPVLGLSSSTIASPTANPATTTTYTVTITNSINGCTATDDVEVIVDNTPPIVYAGSDFTKTCVLNTNGGVIGEAQQLGHNYLWSPIAGLNSPTSSNPTANPISTTSYTVTITNNATGCTATDEVDITVSTNTPTVNAGLNFTKTCVVNVNGATIGETEQLGHSYQWSPATGLSSTSESSPLANPLVTTTYIVTITDDNTGCTSTDQVVVTVNNEEPTVNAGSDFSKTCILNINGAIIGEVQQPGHTYVWSPGAGLSSTSVSNPLANPLLTTTYTVTITKTLTGCSSTDQVQVTVNNSQPTIDAGTDFTKTCVNNANGLEIGELGQPGHTYIWSPTLGLSSANVPNPIANPSGTTTYTVTITDNSSACTSTDQVVITVNNTPPIADAGSGFTKTCISNPNGASIGEAAQIGHSYLWSPGSGLNSFIVSNPIANPTITTIYSVTITDDVTGCTSSDIVNVTVNTNPPTVNAGLDFTKTCVGNTNGASIGEIAQLGHTYLWSPGSGLSSTTASNPTANPTITTTYIVTITNTVSGCTSTDQVLASVDTNPPAANAGSDFTKNCVINSNGAFIGESLQVGYTYSWSPGTGLSSSSIANPFANPSATTTYTVTITDDATGCTATDQILVSVKHCLSGNVFNDLDGLTDSNVDGIGTNVGGLLYITLLDPNDNPIATTAVNADGSYAFTDLDLGNYTIVLSTAFFGTSPSTPFNWVNTGEGQGVMNNDGFIDGLLSITLIGDITNANFGIEQLPFSIGGTAPSVVNPGDTLTQIIPAAMFETVDFDGGFVTSIRLTAFPTNAVSIFVDGIKYTTSNFPIQGIIIPVIGGLPTQEISVDPIDGAINVTIPFVAIDNADREDQSPGFVVQPFGTVGIGGNVYNDLGGLFSNVNVDGAGTNATGLYVTLMSGTTVIATTQVDPDGTYSFTGINAGSYNLILTTINGATSPSLPINWVNTGENHGLVGNDGNTNGVLTILVSNYESNANFGIEQLPNSIGGTAPSVLNPGGTESKIVPAETFESTDPDGGIVTSIRITGFPSNASSITINGMTYYSYNFPSIGVIVPVIGGLPTQEISVDPIDGAVTVSIPFVAIDNANKEDLTPGFALQPFETTAISGNVFNDLGGLVTNNNIDGSGTNVGGQMYVTILNENNVAIATTPVEADGTYTFTGINGGTYSLVLSTSSFGVNSNVPSNWVNTGENHGLVGNDGNSNGVLSVIVSGEVTQANFGIEQLPSANVESIASQVNPGGTNQVNVPASIFGGADPDGGIIIGILITDFPTNATSIIINGTSYTSSTFPYGGVAVPTNAQGEPVFPISVDPIDGAVDVVIPYVTIDNAAKQSLLEGSATLPFGCNPPVVSTPQDVSICSGQSIIITTTTTGGVEPYAYQWSNTNATSWTITVSPVINTTYVITVTDAVGCSATNDIMISVNEKPTFNVHPDASLCFGESITVTPTAQGGEPPYTYYVNGDPLLGPQFVMNANSTTTYIFIVEDANGCGNYDEVNIIWPSANLACDITLVNEVCCINGNDGSALVNVQGGYSPYTFLWDNNENTATASSLNAGLHNVTVTDANGCTTQCSVNINIKEVDLSLAKLVSNANPTEGENIMFTLVIENASTNNATGVAIEDDLPFGFTVPTNISHGGIYSAGLITWSNLTITANTTFQLTYTTSILSFDQNQYVNTAQVTDLDQLDSDSNPNNGADTNNNGSIGSTDVDSSFDSLDEDDGDDAVVIKSSALGNYLWIDSNGNGEQDANEVGLNGQTIYLYNEFDQLIASTVTGVNPIDTTKDGYYIFNNIAPGNYYVSANMISNYLFTTPNMIAVSDNLDSDLDGSNGPNTTAIYSIGVNERNLTVDIGIYKSASIGDFVWEDHNTVNFPGNSIQDANEEGRNGVTVYLYDATTNLVVDQMVTQNHPLTGDPGWYTFYDLSPGQYYVQFELPANFQFVTPNQGPNMMDSDVSDLALGTTDLITILPGDSIINVDAGLVAAIVLPVDFILFEGHYNSTTKENELTWITASEVNCDYYIVERSIEANNFEQIGKVDGHGTSNVKNTYFFNDDDTNTSGIYYYKLRQLDIDGRVNYSGVIKIIVPKNNVTDVSIMPNPALDFIQLNVSAQKGEVLNAAIYDASGKFIMNLVHNQKLTENVEDIRVDVSMMPRGIYLVRSTVNNAEFVHKLVLLH